MLRLSGVEDGVKIVCALGSGVGEPEACADGDFLANENLDFGLSFARSVASLCSSSFSCCKGPSAPLKLVQSHLPHRTFADHTAVSKV